jgi:hypothetical protein
VADTRVVDIARAREVSDLARELGKTCRALSHNAMTVELALERRDWDTVHEAAEVIVTLTARFIELRRGLLVAGVRRVGD